MSKLRRYLQQAKQASWGLIPGFGDQITQIRPTNEGGNGELNDTLNALWERLFGTSAGGGAVFILISILAVIVLVNAGIRYITAAGKADRVTQARTMITQAILAIILLVSTYAIIRIIVSLAVYLARAQGS